MALSGNFDYLSYTGDFRDAKPISSVVSRNGVDELGRTETEIIYQNEVGESGEQGWRREQTTLTTDIRG